MPPHAEKLRPDNWETSFFEIRGEIGRFTDKLAKQKLRRALAKEGEENGGCAGRGAAARAARCEEARAAHKFPRRRRDSS